MLIFYFLIIAGFIIGLGAVTVIDLHGFLGRHSSYWTEATTRTHKVTKPLIWIGITLLAIGTTGVYQGNLFFLQLAIIAILVLNGFFLSFSVSPFLLNRETEGHASDLLPAVWQRKITASFIVSFLGWWGSVLLFAFSISDII